MMRRAAPDERSGVAAALPGDASATASSSGAAASGRRPGDLVFWHDTYDRNRQRRAPTTRFTHVGIVEYVVDGTVVFLHRGAHGRRARRDDAATGPGERDARTALASLNSPLRARTRAAEGAPVLAGALFAGYGRIDPATAPAAAGSPRADARPVRYRAALARRGGPAGGASVAVVGDAHRGRAEVLLREAPHDRDHRAGRIEPRPARPLLPRRVDRPAEERAVRREPHLEHER